MQVRLHIDATDLDVAAWQDRSRPIPGPASRTWCWHPRHAIGISIGAWLETLLPVLAGDT